jgi:hypothetical protein
VRELGAIKDGSWIEGNIIMISQKDRKMKKIKQWVNMARATCKSQRL